MAAVVALVDRTMGYAFSTENLLAFGFARASDPFAQHTQRDQELYCRWNAYANGDGTATAEGVGAGGAEAALRRSVLEDAADRRAYTRAAMDALRDENMHRQSAASVARSTISAEPADGEEIIGFIDEDGNIVHTEAEAVGIVSRR